MPLIDLKHLNVVGRPRAPRVTETAAPSDDRPSD